MWILWLHTQDHLKCTENFLPLENLQCSCSVQSWNTAITWSIYLQCTYSVPAPDTGSCPQCLCLQFLSNGSRFRCNTTSHKCVGSLRCLSFQAGGLNIPRYSLLPYPYPYPFNCSGSPQISQDPVPGQTRSQSRHSVMPDVKRIPQQIS